METLLRLAPRAVLIAFVLFGATMTANFPLLFGLLLTPPRVREVSRLTGPQCDAVQVQVDVDATVATITEVYLVPHGEPLPPREEAVFRADHVENLSLEWGNPARLTIRATAGRVFKAEGVRVRIPDTERSPSAPPRSGAPGSGW